MSATIDERVVRMEFDNKDFEKNVHTSLSTLDKLKNALGFTKQKEELQTLATAVNTTKFDGMVSSIEAIQDKFSAFGNFGRRIIENLADDFYNFSKNVISAIPNQIATGGWKRALNVEEAKFTLKGLGVAWNEVADDIDHAVLGTAYGADEASKAAAQLAASGVQWGGVIGYAEDGTEVFSEMGRALRGISGVAAMTNSSYSEIANIFTTVAGQGKLMTQQLRMMESRGLNAAASMAKVFNTTEEEVREMVHDGEIDFQLFADAMDLAFGEHATAANETFQGSMDNMKAALSRIGQDYAQTILQQTPQVFNSLKGFFNKIRNYTRPFADNIFTPLFTKAMTDVAGYITSITEKLPDMSKNLNWFFKNSSLIDYLRVGLEGIYNIFRAMESVIKPIAQAFLEMFSMPSLTSIGVATRNFEELTRGLILTEEQSAKVHDTFSIVFNVLKDITEIIGKVIHTLSPLGKVFVSLVKSSIRIVRAFTRLFNKLRGGNGASDKFAKSFDKAYEAIDKFADILVSAIDSVTSFVESLIDTKIYEFIQWIKDGISAIKEFNDETGIITNTFVTIGKILAAPIYLLYQLGIVIYNFVKQVYEMPQVQAFIGAVVDKLKELGTIGYEAIKKVVEYLQTVNIKQVILDVRDAIVDLWDRIKGFFAKLSESSAVVRAIKDEFVKLYENFKLLRGGVSAHTIYEEIEEPMAASKSVIETLREAVEKAFTVIKDFFSRLDADKLIAIAFTGAMIGMVAAVWKLVSGFTTLITGATDMIGAFKGIADSISGFFKSWSKKEPNKILEFAEAMAIFTTCLVALVYVGKNNDLWGAVAVLAAISGGLLVFTFVLSKFSKSVKNTDTWKELAVLDATMLAISGSVLILVAAFKVLGNVDLKSAQSTLLVIAELAAIMLGITFILSKFTGKGLRGFLTLIAFSLVLRNFGKAMTDLSGVNFKNIKDNIATLVVVFIGLAAVAAVASNIGLFSAVGIIALVLTLNKIMPMLENLSKADVPNLTMAIRENIDLIKTLGLIALAMVAVSAFFGKGIKRFGIGMILISAALIVIAKAIDLIGSISAGKAKQGTKVIMEILGMFALLALITSIGGGKNGAIKVAAAIGIFTLCLYPLAGVMWILGTMDAKKVEQGTKAIAALMVCFGVVALLSSFGNGMKTTSILALVVGVIALCGELIALTFIPADQIKYAVEAIVSVLLAFAALLFAAGRMGNQAHPIAVIFQYLALTAPLIAIAGALYLLSKQPCDSLLASAAAISAVLLAYTYTLTKLSGENIPSLKETALMFIDLLGILAPIVLAVSAMSLVVTEYGIANVVTSAAILGAAMLAYMGAIKLLDKENIPSAIETVKIFLSLILTLAPVVAAIALLSYFGGDWQTILSAAASIALVITAFGVICAILSKLKVSIKTAAEAAVALAGFMDLLIGILGFTAWLVSFIPENVFTNIEDGLKRMIVVSQLIGEMIGSFIGEMFKTSIMQALEGTGVGLSNFWESAQPFIEGMKTIDNSVAEGAKNLAQALGYLTLADFIDSIFGSSSIEDSGFNDKLSSFGKGLFGFATAVKGIDSESAEQGCQVAARIFALDPPNEGGLIAEILGDNTYDKFDQQRMVKFALGLKSFAFAVKEIDVEAAADGCRVADMIFSLKPPNEGGFVAAFLGDNTYEKFNAVRMGVLGLGGGIKAFVSQVKDFTESDVSAAISACEILNTLYKVKVKKSGGLFGDAAEALYGQIDEGKLKDRFTALGSTLVAFSDSISSLSDNAVSRAETASNIIAAFDDIKIDTEGGFLNAIKSIFAGKEDVESFKSRFINLGQAVGGFYNEISSVQPEVINAGVAALEDINNFLGGIEDFNDDKIEGFVTSMETAGNLGVESFCNALINSKDQVDTATASFMSTAASSVQSNQSIFSNSAESVYSGFMGNLTGANGFDMGGMLTGDSAAMDTLGLSLDTSLGESLTDYSSLVTDGSADVVQAMFDGYMDNLGMSNMTSASSVMEGLADTSIGSYATQLIDTSNLNKVNANATKIAEEVHGVLENGSASASNAAQDAKNTLQGYVNGLGDEQIKSSAIDKVRSFAAEVRRGWQRFWDEHSPSVVAAEDSANVVYGYAIGIEKNIGVATAAMNNLNTSVYDSLRDATSGVSDYVAENMDLTPTITPYIDTSGVDRDVQNLNSLFEDGNQLTINSKLGVMADAMGGYADAQTAGSNNIVDAINLLNENVRTLYGVVGNLQVVMDSGTLVGAIAPGMDVALGQRANLKRRGV